jgi:hypothetical protein
MRGDDALARAAADIAAPRRRLLAALRDAHAEASLRIASLRECDAMLSDRHSGPRAVLARLLGEAEEQLRRLEILFAGLRERPGAGIAPPAGLRLAALVTCSGPDDEATLVLALLALERSGAEEARRLRHLAWAAGNNLAARLLDLTAAEREGTARGLEVLARLRSAGSSGAH